MSTGPGAVGPGHAGQCARRLCCTLRTVSIGDEELTRIRSSGLYQASLWLLRLEALLALTGVWVWLEKPAARRFMSIGVLLAILAVGAGVSALQRRAGLTSEALGRFSRRDRAMAARMVGDVFWYRRPLMGGQAGGSGAAAAQPVGEDDRAERDGPGV